MSCESLWHLPNPNNVFLSIPNPLVLSHSCGVPLGTVVLGTTVLVLDSYVRAVIG